MTDVRTPPEGESTTTWTKKKTTTTVSYETVISQTTSPTSSPKKAKVERASTVVNPSRPPLSPTPAPRAPNPPQPSPSNAAAQPQVKTEVLERERNPYFDFDDRPKPMKNVPVNPSPGSLQNFDDGTKVDGYYVLWVGQEIGIFPT